MSADRWSAHRRAGVPAASPGIHLKDGLPPGCIISYAFAGFVNTEQNRSIPSECGSHARRFGSANIVQVILLCFYPMARNSYLDGRKQRHVVHGGSRVFLTAFTLGDNRLGTLVLYLSGCRKK